MADFRKALDFVLPHEGGYSNVPGDRGGETMYGITEAVARSHGYTGAMADLPLDLAAAWYEADYWPGLDQVVNQAVAAKILDLRVNFGVAGGNRVAQEAVNQVVEPPVAVDGRMGPDTLDAINSAPPSDYLKALATTTAEHYQGIVQNDPDQAKFLGGWLKRAMDLPAVAVGGAGLVLLLLIGGLIWMAGRGGRA